MIAFSRRRTSAGSAHATRKPSALVRLNSLEGINCSKTAVNSHNPSGYFAIAPATGVSSLSIVRSMVRLISDTTAGTSR